MGVQVFKVLFNSIPNSLFPGDTTLLLFLDLSLYPVIQSVISMQASCGSANSSSSQDRACSCDFPSIHFSRYAEPLSPLDTTLHTLTTSGQIHRHLSFGCAHFSPLTPTQHDGATSLLVIERGVVYFSQQDLPKAQQLELKGHCRIPGGRPALEDWATL